MRKRDMWNKWNCDDVERKVFYNDLPYDYFELQLSEDFNHHSECQRWTITTRQNNGGTMYLDVTADELMMLYKFLSDYLVCPTRSREEALYPEEV